MRRCPLLMLLLLASCAAQQAGEPPSSPAPSSAAGTVAVGERLVVEPPAGWRLGYTDDRPEVLLQEYVPSGQTVEKWTDLVTVITFRSVGAGQQPLAYFANATAQVAMNGCEKRASFGRPQLGGGEYPVMYQVVACPKTKRFGSAEIFMARTIKGHEATYQVQRAWRMPARETVQELHLPKEALDEAAAYLATTYVCDTRVPSMPCPP